MLLHYPAALDVAALGQMKLTRISSFLSEFGRVDFLPAEPGCKVLWTPKDGSPRKVHWFASRAEKPSVKLALFFARMGVAQDRGLPPHTFTDQNIDPPTTTQAPASA